MANLITQNIPVGDLQIYDNYVPSLEAGNWHIEVSHTLGGITTGPLGATQEFVVSAPQFALDSSAILNFYPPDGTTGLYGQVLPHLVLKDPMLPWERSMSGSNNVQPWLAVLVLQEEELIGGDTSPTRAQVSTVADFLAPDNLILKPSATKEDDVAGTDPCSFIQISTGDFMALTPRLEDLRFLAHCRQSNITDKAELGLEQNGLFSVVVGNRFPAVPSAGVTVPRKNIAHLVSLEGFESLLVDAPNFGTHTSVAIVSLASWTFLTLPNKAQDFRGLMEAIVGQEYDGTTYTPANLWLRLPTPETALPATAAGNEAAARITDGYSPMQYQLRSGEQTFAWYRGPFAPILTAPLQTSGAFPTADSALIYQQNFGVFDASFAAAWEIGRSIALADRGFGQALFDFRLRGHRLTDALYERLQSDKFSATQIASLSADTSIQQEFLKFLNNDLLQDIGAPTVPVLVPPAPPQSNMPDPDPKTALQNFLADPNVQTAIVSAVDSDLDSVATWLGRLMLLYPVPFNLLVPDARMLPLESLRFFYVDSNWLRAMHDGAVSIGMESSRTTFFHSMTQDLLFESSTEAAHVMRSNLLGVEPPPAEVTENLISGFLLRSAVVSGWPNLAVRGGKSDGTYLKILRLDHVAPNLLLCLFWGVPEFVEFSEPQEGFRFGVDDDGKIALRQPVAGGGTPLATQLKATLQVLPTYLRSADTQVLNLTSVNGLVAAVQTALTSAGVTVANFGPSDFALQMVIAPEAIQFATQTT
jgi:hypothetical protein